jgi:prolyl oligopeptidase
MKLALSLVALCAFAATPALATEAPDPYLWLEDIHGAKALESVTQWNARTEAKFAHGPQFEADRARARDILDDERQIAQPDAVLGDTVVNFWRDAAHPHGQWRSSSLDAYLAGKPKWQVLIDVDALGTAEGKSYVWHGADCLVPAYKRCLIALSPGGGDAAVVREWDMASRSFVAGGFSVPIAKTAASWEDADTLLLRSDFGPGTLTTSGYGRQVRRWKRGTPLSSASLVLDGQATDVSIQPAVLPEGETRHVFIVRGKTFYTINTLIRTPDGRFIPTPLPETAELRATVGGRMIAYLNKALGKIPAGTLVAWTIADVLAGKPGAPEVVFTPARSQAIEDVQATDHVLWIKLLDNVSGKLLALTPNIDGRWTAKAIALPTEATIALAGAADGQDLAFAQVESFLTPPTLYAASADGTVKAVQSLPAKFDASRFRVEQRFAASKDGTRVPYFLARPKGVTRPVPVLIHAYGGFRVPQTPTYLTTEPYRSGPLALSWLEDGNAYVLANIRGGGEYGPAWHDAVLRENRQKAYDDFYAVAEDLVRTRVTLKKKIAISGRSNGGLLVGVAMTQRPDLYGAVIAGSPLEDMQRYSHLLAGASWMAEYGDPEKPSDWAFIRKYSPYQNIRSVVRYPPIFFYSSTEDDRVHPGHARKMAARLLELGNPVEFHEAREGGHSVGGNHEEDALRAAMLHGFLRRELMGLTD